MVLRSPSRLETASENIYTKNVFLWSVLGRDFIPDPLSYLYLWRTKFYWIRSECICRGFYFVVKAYAAYEGGKEGVVTQRLNEAVAKMYNGPANSKYS